MHELSIAQSILSIADNALAGNKFSKVSAIKIQVGELSGIETDALLFSFNIIKSDTVLNEANLDIEIIPGEAVCNKCNTVFHLERFGNACPNCNDYSMHILKGKEMKVLNLVVED